MSYSAITYSGLLSYIPTRMCGQNSQVTPEIATTSIRCVKDAFDRGTLWHVVDTNIA